MLTITNGVRQGGVLSPILYITYIDVLNTYIEGIVIGEFRALMLT